jgi:hypothetical protein
MSPRRARLWPGTCGQSLPEADQARRTEFRTRRKGVPRESRDSCGGCCVGRHRGDVPDGLDHSRATDSTTESASASIGPAPSDFPDPLAWAAQSEDNRRSRFAARPGSLLRLGTADDRMARPAPLSKHHRMSSFQCAKHKHVRASASDEVEQSIPRGTWAQMRAAFRRLKAAGRLPGRTKRGSGGGTWEDVW